MSPPIVQPHVVVVTGSATGIGRLTVELLARSGHVVYASMRDPEGDDAEHANALRTLASTDGLALKAIALDVRHEASCRTAAELVVAEQGRIDVVVNNAAVLMLGVTEAFTAEEILEAVDINAVSWVRVNRAFLPIMRRQRTGLMVYVSSSCAHVIDPFIGPYAASKAAGEVLAETMHYENSSFGIDSVIVVPGAYTSGTKHFDTAKHAQDASVAEQYGPINHLPAQMPSRLEGMHRAGVRTDPAEVAEAIRDVIAAVPGSRQFRVAVDPQRRGMESLNSLRSTLQEDAYRRLGIGHLLRVDRGA